MQSMTSTTGAVLQRVLAGLAFVIGSLWTAPYTLAALLAGLGALPFGARIGVSWRDRAIVVAHWPWGPGGAMTLGNAVLHTGASLDVFCSTYEHRAGRCRHPQVRLGDHERAHVYQYMLLGPLFVPVYFACGGISVRNPFERAADHYAMHGRGWWPWSRRT